MNRFINSESIEWRVSRWTTALVSGILATCVLWVLLGRHCTESLYLAFMLGPPAGVSLAVGALVQARHGRWLRTAAVGLLVAMGLLAVFSVAAANLFGTINRGRQKYTMADMRETARAIEEGRSVEKRIDGWGTPYLIRQGETGYAIVSFGDCGVPDVAPGAAYPHGTTNSFEDDIVFANGEFTRYPEGAQQ